VLWGTWHAPKFFLAGQGGSAIPFFLGILVSVIAQTILMTWVYNHAGGSLLLATLFHFSSDAFLTFFLPAWVSPSGVSLIFALMTVLQAEVAVLVVVRLSRKPTSATTARVESTRAGLP